MEDFYKTVLDNAKKMVEDPETLKDIISIQQTCKSMQELTALEVAMEYLDDKHEEKMRRLDFFESRF